MAEVVLRCQVERIGGKASPPVFLTFCFVSTQVQTHRLVVEKLRFILLFIEKPHPKQILCILEVYRIESEEFCDKLFQIDPLLGFGPEHGFNFLE